jgi:ATP-dependent Lon protease
VENVKPIQLSQFDFVDYLLGREHFTSEQWIDVLLQSIGFDPEHFSRRKKLLQLSRLIAFAERNYNLIELGPKGTGKSHVFSEFSPHGMLISGGEVTLAKLFVNNASGKIGLVGYWDSVAFDEFAGKEKRIPQNLVDVMKNYMANKTFSRGRESLGAEASMVFIGNTRRSVNYMLKHADLFEPLPKAYYDTAFLDRLHCYLPGWEVDIIRGEMFTDGFGFIVDYLAEVLRFLRSEDFSGYYKHFFTLDASIATRDRTAIHKTFGGLMKILYPHGECGKEEVRELLEFALEGRRRVKLQLMKMDETFREREVRFLYTDIGSGEAHEVSTLEEEQYMRARSQVQPPSENELTSPVNPDKAEADGRLPTGINIVVRENQRGISYANLFGDYLRGASEIHLVDPYLRKFYQIRNLYEFCQLIYRQKTVGEEVRIRVFTTAPESEHAEAEKLLSKLEGSLYGSGIDLSFEIAPEASQHDRYLETDTGYKVILGRGLDIFQRYDQRDTFDLAHSVQEERECKPFEVTVV